MTLYEAVQNVAGAVSQEEAIRRAYDILTVRYRGERVKTYLLLWRLFENDTEKLWSRTGFLHCTKLSQLLKYLLIESGWFQKENVRLCWTQVWLISPHQYVRIRLNTSKELTLDVWGVAKGIAYGDYAHGLH